MAKSYIFVSEHRPLPLLEQVPQAIHPLTGLFPICIISESIPSVCRVLAISVKATNVLPFLMALPLINNTFIML